jgi:hypothetical protein
MINLLYQFLALAGVIIMCTFAIEILGRTYISRKLNNQQKYLISISTIITAIYILLICLKFYAINRNI